MKHTATLAQRITARLPFRLFLITAFVLLLVWRIDVLDALERMRTVDYRWVSLGLVVFTLSKFIHAYRWRLFLSQHKLPLAPLFGIFLTSNLANALIPLRAGDLMRVQVPHQRFGTPRAELTATVYVVETLLDGMTFVVLLMVGLVFLDVPMVSRTLFGSLALLVALGFAAAVAIARLDTSGDVTRIRPIRWLPDRARGMADDLLPRFVDGMSALRNPRTAARAIAVSFAAWLIEVVVYWMLGQAFGLELPFTDYVLVMIGANMVVSLPLTPWDVGPYEVAVAEVLVLLGAESGVAGSYAIGSHLLLLTWISVTGIAATWLLGLSPRDLFGASQQGG